MGKIFKSNSGAIVIGALALVIAAAGGAMAAGGGSGGTITACVQKGSGSLYQAKKCKKGDKKLAWSKQGPQGPAGKDGAAGKDGTNGTNGTNGAVAGFSATKAANVAFTGSSKTILTLSLPAGSFIVQSKTAPSAAATTAGYFNDRCTTADGSAADSTQYSTALVNEFLFDADGAVSMQIAVTSSTPSTVTLSCEDVTHEGTNFSTGTSNSVITAVQTSSNS